MKIRTIGVFLAVVAVSLFAGQKKETKIDSMQYEIGAEWKIYSTGSPVRSFALQNNVIWYVTEAGVSSLSTVSTKKNAEMQVFKDLGGVPAADATTCAVDFSSGVWVGTKSGLAMRTKDSFKVFKTENGLSDNKINRILPLRSGKMWVATDNGVSLYQGGAWTVYTTKNGLAGDKVRDIVAGPANTVWFGTDKGISCFDGAKWTSYNMKNGLSWNDTKAIAFDAKTGTIWAAVGEKDINSYDGKAWKVFMDVAEGVVSIMADTQSRIWIATAAGLMKFNGDEWISDPQKIGITAAQVMQMQRDDKGNLWFGMESGVMKLDNPYPY